MLTKPRAEHFTVIVVCREEYYYTNYNANVQFVQY